MPAAKKPKPAAESRAQRLLAFAKSPVRSVVSWVSIGTLSVFVAAVYFVEDRYAHATDMRQMRADLTSGQEINRLTTEVETLNLKIQLLRANLSQITFAQGPVTQDRKKEMERIGTDIRDAGIDLSAKKQLLDRMKAGK